MYNNVLYIKTNASEWIERANLNDCFCLRLDNGRLNNLNKETIITINLIRSTAEYWPDKDVIGIPITKYSTNTIYEACRELRHEFEFDLVSAHTLQIIRF